MDEFLEWVTIFIKRINERLLTPISTITWGAVDFVRGYKHFITGEKFEALMYVLLGAFGLVGLIYGVVKAKKITKEIGELKQMED